MMSFIIWCIIFAIFNVLDLVTTYAAMGSKPANEIQKHEMNPFLDNLIPHKRLTWIIKIGGVGLIIAILIHGYQAATTKADALSYLRLVAAISILMIFVIINNIHAKWAEDHHHLTLGKLVTTKLHLPKIAAFYLIIFALLGLSYAIVYIFY